LRLWSLRCIGQWRGIIGQRRGNILIGLEAAVKGSLNGYVKFGVQIDFDAKKTWDYFVLTGDQAT
jgi:hypothetical protein